MSKIVDSGSSAMGNRALETAGPPLCGDCEWKVKNPSGAGMIPCPGKWETVSFSLSTGCYQSVCSHQKERANAWHKKWWVQKIAGGPSFWIKGSTSLRSVDGFYAIMGLRLGYLSVEGSSCIGCFISCCILISFDFRSQLFLLPHISSHLLCPLASACDLT